MKTRVLRSMLGLLICGTALQLNAGQPGVVPLLLPGLKDDGSLLLPNQWSLRPTGQQVALGDFPVNIAVHPEGRFAAILHSGHGPHEVVVVDILRAVVVSRTKVNESFYGIQFSNGGGRLYCSGASDELVHVYEFNDGALTELEAIHLRDSKERGIPCGLALSQDAQRMFVANLWGQRISQVDLFTRSNVFDLPMGAGAMAGDVHRFEPVAKIDPDLQAVTKRDEAQFDPSSPDAPFPYAIQIDEQRQRLYVSLWAQSCVAVVDLKTRQVVERWPTGEHPNEMILSRTGRHLFVANANHNTVSVIDTSNGLTLETLDSAFSPTLPPGSTPNSLALSPDQKTLFVANACNNNIAVFDVSLIGRSHSLGFIPVGWYPTSVRLTPDGKYLLVANGKGLMSKPNPKGPQPMGPKPEGGFHHIADLFPGWLSIIELSKGKQFQKQLAGYTEQAYLCTPAHSVPQTPPMAGNPVPFKPGQVSPIKYCVYIIKENRTYDQVLGDMREGNGDTNLCIFPERVTPNHHRLAREFVLLDNFYVDAEVSADGHEWSMGAYATDFVEKIWPLNYGHGRSKKYPYPAEGKFPVAVPAGGYLWDRAREAKVTYRSYGEFVSNGKTAEQPATTRVSHLQGHFDPYFRSFDTSYPDAKRADRFISELNRFEKEGEMPRLQIVRLPNDHTVGAGVGQLTPTAYLADNDLAFGRVVEALSHSKFWNQMAIFVLEDDAQNGPDHVDAHRSPAFVISPYTRRHAVDSTMYSTSSLLRTMELILGLKPMTQFDAAATPMYQVFQPTPDLTPYKALPTNVDLNERNTRVAWGAEASRKMDFTKEDAMDDLLLNEIIWRSVRGASNPMPAPKHAAFVFTKAKDKDGD